VGLALIQRLAGDTPGATTTAEQARSTLEQLYRNQPNADFIVGGLSQAYGAIGKKDSAPKEAQRAITIGSAANDPVNGPSDEENLAVIQTMLGANRHAISTVTRLLQSHTRAGFTALLLRPPFLGSIPSGARCAAIPLSRDSARKSSRKPSKALRSNAAFATWPRFARKVEVGDAQLLSSVPVFSLWYGGTVLLWSIEGDSSRTRGQSD